MQPPATMWRAQVAVSQLSRSPSWDSAQAQATVVVATCNRAAWLADLLRALEQQDGVAIEVVIIDDSSVDATSQVLGSLSTSLPLLALRTAANSGPSAARNAGVAEGRTGLLLFTDDDCLPSRGWAAALLRELAAGAAVVQGRTVPVDGDHGAWDRSITITGPTGLYETCNLGLCAAAFRGVGGFADLGLLPGPAARGFGEDAELGSRVAERGRAGWAADALVQHRWVSASFADHLAGRRRLVAFPGLAALVPEVRERLVAGALLSSRTLVTDAGLLGAVAALASRRPWPLVAALPWAGRLLAEAAHRPGRPRLVRAAQLTVADVVGAGALVRGSLRARRLVL